jgi:hypothetical protein
LDKKGSIDLIKSPSATADSKLNLAITLLQEFSYFPEIKSGRSIGGDDFLMILPTARALKNETILLYSNYDRINLSKNVRSALLDHGNLVRILDLSTFDTNTADLNFVFSMTPNVHSLIMPIQGDYSIDDIKFPDNIKELVIYNKKVSGNKLQDIINSSSLQNLVFWGCDSLDIGNFSDIKIVENSVRSLTLLNAGLNLRNIFHVTEFKNLDNIVIDDYDLLRKFITRKNLSEIEYHTYRFTSNKNFPIVGLVTRELKKLRNRDFPAIIIKVIDNDI